MATQRTPESRVTITANIFLVVAVLWTISFIMNLIAQPAAAQKPEYDAMIAAFSMFLSGVFIVLFYVTGFALKKRLPWARSTALWASVILCLSIIGVFLTWYIWKQLGYPEVKALFGNQPATTPTPPTTPSV